MFYRNLTSRRRIIYCYKVIKTELFQMISFPVYMTAGEKSRKTKGKLIKNKYRCTFWVRCFQNKASRISLRKDIYSKWS